MNAMQKAKERYNKFYNTSYHSNSVVVRKSVAKENAIKSVEIEYNSLRELLFDLRSSHVIENEKVYLSRLQILIDEEETVKAEIEKL